MIVLAGGDVLQSSKQSQTPVRKLEPAQIYRVVEKCERPEKHTKFIHYTNQCIQFHAFTCCPEIEMMMTVLAGGGVLQSSEKYINECIQSELPVLRAHQGVMSSSTWRAKTPQRRSKGTAKAPRKHSKDAAKMPQRRSKGATKGAAKAQQRRHKSVPKA